MDIDWDKEWDKIFSAPATPEELALCQKIVERRDKRIVLYAKRKKTPWGRIQNWIDDRKQFRQAIEFIMHGPGGD